MTFQQQKTLGNAASTVCHPIDWPEILKQPEKFTPKTVRAYLVSVVDKMNKHMALWMDGPSLGRIRVTRRSRMAQRLLRSICPRTAVGSSFHT